MNVAEYISSGIIESYVLGLADAQEAAELAQMRRQYPEVEAAITAFEQSLEAHARATAIAPPEALKPRLMAAINSEKAAPVVPITMANNTQIVSFRRWRIAAAAAVILLVASLAINAYFANRISNLSRQQNELLTKTQQLEQRAAEVADVAKMMADSTMFKVMMKSVPQQPPMLATVLWDTKTKDVYLFCNNMPQPAADKQYQLWAIVDGQPVDAGVLEMTREGTLRAVKMKNIPRAQAFAITLEKRGGSPTPDLEAMQVMGKI